VKGLLLAQTLVLLLGIDPKITNVKFVVILLTIEAVITIRNGLLQFFQLVLYHQNTIATLNYLHPPNLHSFLYL